MIGDGTREPPTGRPPRNARPRDELGRPLPYGAPGTDRPESDPHRTPADTLAAAQRLLDDGLPFHAHEVLEEAWKAAPADERELWRGLAQLAVGATHAARGNAVGAQALLNRGAALVAGYGGTSPHGLDVGRLLEWAEAARRRVERGVPAVLDPLPLRSLRSPGDHHPAT